jgi:hypothetical protein
MNHGGRRIEVDEKESGTGKQRGETSMFQRDASRHSAARATITIGRPDLNKKTTMNESMVDGRSRVEAARPLDQFASTN